MPRVLNVGASGVPLQFPFPGFEEVRLDIDAAVKPHIVADMRDMGDIGEYEVVLCIHALEHLYPYDVERALSEFYRVAMPSGCVLVMVPDIEDVKPTNEILYESEAGPVTGLDMIYGYGPALKENPYMAHHMGFTRETLKDFLVKTGLKNVTMVIPNEFNIIGYGFK